MQRNVNLLFLQHVDTLKGHVEVNKLHTKKLNFQQSVGELIRYKGT